LSVERREPVGQVIGGCDSTSPEYLQPDGVPEDLIKNIAITGALVAKAVE
jgi:hypothetical protein